MKPSLPATNPPSKLWLLAVMAGTLALAPLGARAVIVGPYSPDGNTLHLWHLDQSAVPAVDSAPGGTNLTVLGGTASLGNASFPGFGNALGTGTSGTANYCSPQTYTGNAADNTYMAYADTNTGAFTLEALVRVDFDPTVTQAGVYYYLITGENQDGQDRPFQWTLFPKGVASGAAGDDTTKVRLRFYAGASAAPNNVIVFVPATGPDAIAQGSWYHVAVTFSGSVLKQYWTLMDASRIQANLLAGPGGATGQSMSLLNPVGIGSPCFMLGNQGRSRSGNSIGRIDEVRISQLARSSTDMMFNSLEPVVLTHPVGTTNAVGQPLSLSVLSAGAASLSYQWRTNGIAIPGATAASYNLSTPQLSDSADYTVVITNTYGSVTSAIATVLIRTPASLTWLGTASADWETAALNWDSNGDSTADAAYAPGDKVRFDDLGAEVAGVNLVGALTPLSVMVDSDFDYVLSTGAGGGLAGSCGLTKRGNGTLTLDTDNTYTGPTVIEGGSLTVGNEAGLGAFATRGSLGSGPITNLAELAFNRAAGSLTLTNSITGNGSLVLKDINALSVRLMGANTMCGPITINKGNLTVGPAGLGGSTNITLYGVTAGGSSFTLSGGVVVGPDVQFTGYTANPGDNRVNIINEAGSNVWNGSIDLEGNAPAILAVSTGSLEVSGPVSGPAYSDFFTWRGNGLGIQSGQINLPNGNLQKIDGGTYLLRSTGNSFLYTRLTGGTLRLGINNGLPTSSALALTATLDLAGYNQEVASLFSTNAAAPFAPNASGVIASSSTNADSVFTLNTTSPDNFLAGRILDATAGGTRKVGLTLTGGGTLTLTNISTYTGDTLIKAGTLALSNAASIGNSANIVIASGAALSATLRTGGGMTLNAAQTLKGNGTVLGDLTAQGTVSPGAAVGVFTIHGNGSFGGTGQALMEVNNAAAASDLLQVNGTLTYGGTLTITNLSAVAYTNNQVLKLFNATGGYSGSFTTIVFPGVAAYDASNLAVDGTIRVVALVSTAPVTVTATVTGGNTLHLAWPPDHTTWRLLGQTNAPGAGLSTNWFYVPGSSSTNQVFLPLDPAVGSVFYRLVYP